MLSNHIDRFLRDESGGYTIWGLTWFMLYVGIGGLAVDMTDAFRNQSMLQATADAAALAGIMSPLSDETEVDTWALNYAALNMPSGVHGDVLKNTEVDIGTWNFTTRTFSVGGSKPNAVRAITRRDAINANPVATNFLRIIGLQTWNVNTEAIAAIGIDQCFNNGIIAGGTLDVKPHTNFIDNICLIGVEQFEFRKNDTSFEEGVYVGAGCGEEEKKCIGPGNQVYDNDDFARAFEMDIGGDGNYLDTGGNYDVDIRPVNALNVLNYINAVKDLAFDPDADPTAQNNYSTFENFLIAYNDNFVDYSGLNYLSEGYAEDDEGNIISSGEVPDYALVTGDEFTADMLDEDGLKKYTVYHLAGAGCPQNGYPMPGGNYQNVAVIADCPISFETGVAYELNQSLVASTYSSQGRAAISGQSGIDLGPADLDCIQWAEMYSLGDINFASGGNFPNLRILADGDIHLAASSDSHSGTDIQATGDVFMASGANNEADGSTYGYCEGSGGIGPKVLTAALVQ
jgi:hypothetical protein